MRSGITFDDSLWPLLISRFTGTLSNEEFEEYLRRGAEYLERGEAYVSVLDMGRLQLPTAFQRQRQLEWMKGKEQAMREQVKGCAFVITSPIIRLALSTIFHIVPLPTPYVAVQDVATGVQWALGRLEACGREEDVRRVLRHLAAPVPYEPESSPSP